MINKNSLKHIYKIALKGLLLATFLAFSSSCTDQGCIEADDFGEYESQTLEVTANSSQDQCRYDPAKEITDADQGSGIKSCFISGTHTIYDENNDSYSSNPSGTGCTEFTDAKIKNLCINFCVTKCLDNAGSNAGSAEPNWKSTDKKSSTSNAGVTIRPGSEIEIRAIGNIKLGDSLSYQPIFIKANTEYPNSANVNFENIFFDVRNGQTLDINFSGQWQDGADDSQIPEEIGSGASASIDDTTYNAAKRTVVYLIPHPDGYDFDTSATSEEAGSKNIPLLPDPRVWTCDYTGSNATESICKNKTDIDGGSYSSLYNLISNSTAAITAFPISSDFKTTTLSTYGGIIRWKNDGLKPDSYDPFTSITCNSSGNCPGIDSINDDSRLVGDLSGAGGVVIENTSEFAYKVSFKSLTGDNSCNIALNVVLATSGDVAVYDTLTTPLEVNVTSGSWSSNHITLEKGQKLLVKSDTSTYGSGVNCGRAIVAKLRRYHDIQLDRSGFVRLTMLNGSGNCTVKGRIVNPEGWQTDYDASQSLYDDIYEYESFVKPNNVINPYPFNLIDPLRSLVVPATSAISSSINWSNKFFVRKGQIIRFSPETWNNTWSAAGLTRECGIGMAMEIQPRPALLCKGTSSELIDNPDCVTEYDGATLIGCQATAAECLNDSDLSNYCPYTDCQTSINDCVNGTAANNYAKTGCVLGDTMGVCNSEHYSGGMTEASCDACSILKLSAASQAAKIHQSGIDQCYDLENYKGSASNIPNTGFSSSQFSDANITRGLTKVSNFNGVYGNLDGFIDSNEVDPNTSNRIFSVRTPLTFPNSGRLRFFEIDNGSTFLNLDTAYTNNSSGTGYNGSNGIKINSSSILNFANGEWLEVKLCKESSDSSVKCKSSQISNSDKRNPALVELTRQDSAGDPPQNNGNYKFDSYGSLIRITPAGSDDCTVENQGVLITSGVTYYCHKNDYHSESALDAMSDSDKAAVDETVSQYRLSFKILDPEPGNCEKGANANSNNSMQSGSGVDDSLWNGILMENPYYDSSNSSNDGKVCTSFSSSCTREYYCTERYANNSGAYYVNVKVKVPLSGQVSSIIGGVITPVVEVMDGTKDGSKVGQAERIYKLLIGDPQYQAIVTMSLVVMFSFYGFGYLIGVSELTHTELISRIVKIGLIYLFIGEQGWEWFDRFVVKLFKDSTDFLAFMMASSFDDSPKIAEAIANNDYYDKSILFSSVDRVFSMFFSQAVQKKISALLFASIFGWAYLLIIYHGFLLYVYAVANAVLLYLTAQVFISILFTLGPIFFIFTLFAQTKEMFNNWLSQLIGFSLQQIFLLTTLAFFNMLMYEVIKMSLGYKICWDEVWTIDIWLTRISLLSFWTIASLPPRTNAHTQVANIGNPEGIPSLFSILFIWVIASLMNKFITFMTDLAASIGGGISASKMAEGVAQTAAGLQKMASSGAQSAWKKTGGRVVQRMDKALFDSGEMADEERQKLKAQNVADKSNKTAMSNAADKAVSDYKTKNALEFSKLSDVEKRKKVADIRDDAMMKEGKKRGLNESDVKRLKNDTGFKYVGENAFGAALAAARQGVSKGGTLRTSIGERESDTALSSKETSKALENMSKEDRAKFTEKVAKGDIRVKKTSYQNLREKGIGGVISSSASKLGQSIKKTAWKDDDYDQARKQLEDEGIVTKRSGGAIGEIMRSDSEKRLIRDRQRQNVAKKKDATKTTSASALQELRRQEQYHNTMEDIKDDPNKWDITKAAQRAGTYVSSGFEGSVGTVGGDLGRSVAGLVTGKKTASENFKKAAVDTRKGKLSKVKERLAENRKEKADLSKARQDAAKDLTEVRADKEFQADESTVAEATKELKSLGKLGQFGSKAASLRKKIGRITSGDKYKAAKAKEQKAMVAMNRIDSQIESLDTQAEDLKDYEDVAIRSEAINEGIQEAAKTSRQDSDGGTKSMDTAKSKSADAKDKTKMEQRKKGLGEQKESHSKQKAAIEARVSAAKTAAEVAKGTDRYEAEAANLKAAEGDLKAHEATGKDLDEQYKSAERDLDSFDSRTNTVDKSDEIYAQAMRDKEAFKEGSEEYTQAQAIIKERDALTNNEESSTKDYQAFVDKHYDSTVKETRSERLAKAAEPDLNSTTNLETMKSFTEKYRDKYK